MKSRQIRKVTAYHSRLKSLILIAFQSPSYEPFLRLDISYGLKFVLKIEINY